jgi:lipooligosaccharide transport system permease protein
MRSIRPPGRASAVTVAPRRVPGPLRVVEREARVFRRLWRGAAFSTLVQPLLFLGAIGLGLGGIIDDGASNEPLRGGSYLAFIAPGLLAASAMQTAAGDSLWTIMAGVKWLGFYHGIVASPLRPWDVYFGHVLWTGVRVAMGATAFLLVATVLGGVASPLGVLAIPAAVLCGMAFAAPLTAYSGRCESDLTFSLVMRLGVIPLFLFSGTFFPLDQLPAGLRPVAWCTPLWHGVELCRGLTTGDIPLLPAVGHVAVLAAFIAAGCWWGRRTFTQRLAA